MPSGFKTFATGEVLTASDVNNYLMEQSICVFADATARDAAITSPEDGQFVFLTGSTTLQFYNSGWTNFIGEGDITGVTAGDGLSGGGTSGAVTLDLDLNELTSATVDVANDSVAIIDATDNSSKKETIADVVNGIAGDGLSATSGQLDLNLTGLSSVTVDVESDDIPFIDATDNSSKKTDISKIQGLSMFDRWYINGDITGTNADITANWTQLTSSLYGYGENMSESSGIFTFPSTGYYKISMYILVDKSTSEPLIRVRCNYTLDNFSTQGSLMTIDFKSQTTNTDRMVGYNQIVLKVDDTSNVKVKFDTSSFNATTVLKNSINESNFIFTKIREL